MLADLGLDWTLAVERVSRDIRDDFFPDPILYSDFLRHRSEVIPLIEKVAPDYRPSESCNFNVPKATLALRHSIELGPIDRIVYQALVDPLVEILDPRFSDRSFSHRLRGPRESFMFLHGVSQWKKFCEAIRFATEELATPFVVETDVAQYFENIWFGTLNTQLESMLGTGLDERLRGVLAALRACWRKWSPHGRWSLPQNVDASSFLGNVYLDRFDQEVGRRWNHFRYMDDVRIVVGSEADARRALQDVVICLRGLGLGVNAQKTRIVRPDEVAAQYAPDDPFYDRVQDALRSEDKARIDSVAQPLVDKALGLLEAGESGSRLFRFCVNRIEGLRRFTGLAPLDQSVLTSRVVQLLPRHPADTATLCRYLATAELTEADRTSVAELLLYEPLCVYSWQNYHLWLLAVQARAESSELLGLAWERLREDAQGPEAVGACLYVGAFGTYADRLRLLRSYSERYPIALRRAMCVAVQEAHAAERNPFYASRASESVELEPLVRHLRGSARAIYVPEPARLPIRELFDHFPDQPS